MGVSRPAIRLSLAGAAALLMAGCSSDSTRLADSGLFGASKADLTPTASIPNTGNQPHSYNAPHVSGPSTPSYTPRALGAGQPISSIVSTPLAPPNPRFAAAATPSPTLNRPAISAPATTGAVATPSTSLEGWRAQGGTPIVVAQGESASTLATRYGVPMAALLKANGFNSPAQIQPGARLIVPVYSAAGASQAHLAPAIVRPAVVAQEPTAPLRPAVARTAGAEKLRFRPGAPAMATARATAPATRPTKMAQAAPAPATPVKTAMTAHAPAAPAAPATKPAKVATVKTPVLPAKPDKAAPQVAVRTQPAGKPLKEAVSDPRKPAVDYDSKTASLPPEPEKDAAAESDKPEFRWPARGRIINGLKTGGNDGINIALPEGTAVKAADGGVVAYAGSELKGYGNLVLIRHPNGFVSAYANNGELSVKRGETVRRGQTIATSGQTGNVASPQLHFELRKGSTPVDPTNYLAGL